MELHSRPLFRNEQELKEFSLLGKTENVDGRCRRGHFRNGQERRGFSLLGKTENGDVVADEAIFSEWTGA